MHGKDLLGYLGADASFEHCNAPDISGRLYRRLPFIAMHLSQRMLRTEEHGGYFLAPDTATFWSLCA
eukprot:1147622-Pelagomonas_calceolata.AAC.8